MESGSRRRCSDELSITKEVVKYLKIRKVAKKAIKKFVKSIKEADKCNEDNAIVGMLKNVEEISIDVFKHMCSQGKNAEKEKNTSPMSEFHTFDVTLVSLICLKKQYGMDMSEIANMRSLNMKLESETQDLVEALECLSRHLLKTRGHLFNIFSNCNRLLLYTKSNCEYEISLEKRIQISHIRYALHYLAETSHVSK
ncbi:hypothetical protein Cgig2_019401 [Carnegiea gigantea]|uniref:Uncharacterized protein n=1 Tax=Carnegiea gigantea TaxID=171969 RepID=A0A9Q1KRL5_9CARY|nr:hypothetical protein Cgig2_019401 [Carnegiea gigantea]